MEGTPKSARGVPPPPPPARGQPLEVPQSPAPKAVPPIGTESGSEAQATTALTGEASVPEQAPSEASGWRERRKNQLTADTLFELDAPTRAVTHDLDVEIETGFLETEHDVASRAAESMNGEASQAATPFAASDPQLLALLNTEALSAPAAASYPQGESPEQQRLRRVTARVLACRDCFRWLGSLGVSDEDRRTVSRLLLELDPVVNAPEGRGVVIKDPEPILKLANAEQLEALDRLLGPIEDRLLALDDLVTPEDFRSQLENRKQSKKIVARYGRVLASRRLPVGQRRDRFETIATHLLTSDGDEPRWRILPPDRARLVLDHLIGGLSKKTKDEEAKEAIAFLRESATRVSQFDSADAFFASGYFIDVHGYKVSTRDQLLNLEFLYLSVLINVEVHNRIEDWIADLEHKNSGNQLYMRGTPREQIVRRLREQEDAVDDSFGGRRKSSADPKRTDAPAPASAPTKKARSSPKPAAASVSFDRQVAKLLASLLVIIASATYVAFDSGMIGREAAEALTPTQLAQISSLLGRGWIIGAGDARRLDGMVLRKRWLMLDARARQEAAERLATTLRGRGIKHAEVDVQGARAIAIDNGLVSFVQGGKL